uniref:Mating-type related plus 2 n=1 Tax=Pseudo-nitzschia multistriata TaxID=183589 RepID=A0A7T8G790_9STRA|nr:mating-type related plus 2 [Pseudo-nitzschia multistriata]
MSLNNQANPCTVVAEVIDPNAVVTAPRYPRARPYSQRHLDGMEAQVVNQEQSQHVTFEADNKAAFFADSSEGKNRFGKVSNEKKGYNLLSSKWYWYAMIAMTLIFLVLVGYGFGSGLFLLKRGNATLNNDPAKDGSTPNGSDPSSISDSSNTVQDRQDYKYSIVTLLGLPMVMERTSPQARAVEWLAYQDEPLFDVTKETSAEEQDRHHEILEQRYALVVWYFDQGGPTVWKTINRDESAGWVEFGAGVHECDWKGVDCDYENGNTETGTVIGLRLSPALGLVLTGTHLSTELGMLTALRRVDFSDQRLQGTIPDEWASMTNLKSVILSKNQLQTTVPEWIGRSSEEGGGWQNLEQLALDDNFLYGSLPSSMRNLRKLTHLELQVNPQLEGRFDELLFLEKEDEATGLPGQNLEILDLSNTRLKGKIPKITLPSIRSFRLWNLPGFSGTLPPDIGSWSNLEIFSIKEMPGLTGTLPTEFGSLEKLEILEVLDSNFMSGELPKELGNLSSNLKTINFRYTNQTGTLPVEWSSLVNLENLNLLQNKYLTGTIPSEYGYMTSLRSLDLRGTSLSGEVSQEVCAIDSMETLQADCSYKNDKSVGKIVCLCCLWCHDV